MVESRLLITLDAYARQLETHLAAMRARHQELETAWARLRDIYEGEAARAFSEAFEAASARLADYGSHGAEVTGQLQAKIEELRRFQSETSGS